VIRPEHHASAAARPSERKPGVFRPPGRGWLYSVEDRAASEYAISASQANERSRASDGGSPESQIGYGASERHFP
jgi:hypothetical protein